MDAKIGKPDLHFKVQGQERQQADFIMADSGNNISAENAAETENTTERKTDNVAERKTDNSAAAAAAAERKRKNSSDSRKLRSAKSAQFSSAIKKGIKMGTTGFSTQVKRKTAPNPGLS